MIFNPENIQKIIDGTKTQTRRIVKSGESFLFDDDDHEHIVMPPNNRLKWQVGNDYAVQPGRGEPGAWWHPGDKVVTFHISRDEMSRGFGWQPLRIRILSLRREPLQRISDADAIAEGYPHEWPPDPMIEYVPELHPDPKRWYHLLWDSIHGAGAWEKTENVWVIEFEVRRD